MATQKEMRAWARENGISCAPRGSLDRDVEDMYLIDLQGFEIPAAQLRAFTIDCRKWVHENVAKLGPRDRMCEVDVHRYMDHLTQSADKAQEAGYAAEVRHQVDDSPVLIACQVDETVDGFDELAKTVRKYLGADITAMQRVMRQDAWGSAASVTTALDEAEDLVNRAVSSELAEDSERLIKEAIPVLEFSHGALERLRSTYHLMYCSGCGDHDNYASK